MVEETENKAKISIWWDIENCHVPKDVDPHYIASNMTAALQRACLTGPIEIQVFGDTTILPYSTQKALSDTGITLNHVPRGNKDAADKNILVAMLLWALENPPPANILLISGDGDFANALHRLRLKTYSILLAIPAQYVKPALTGAAKKLWLWKEMAQGQLAELKLSYSNGDASSKGPGGLSRRVDKFQQRQGSAGVNVPPMYNSAPPSGYLSPQKKIAESKVGSVSEQFRSLSLENHPGSISSTGLSSGNRNRLSPAMENSYHEPSDRKLSQVGDSDSSTSNRLNASQSLPHVSVSSSTVAHGMDRGQYPYFLPPRAGEKVENFASATSNALCNNPEDSRQSQFSSMPAGQMPRGPLKHIAPKNNRSLDNETSARNIVSDKRMDHNVLPDKHNASMYRSVNKCVSPSTLPSNAMMNNPQNVPHDTCLDKIYSAMKTLERDMLAPTESNLADCIQYWDTQNQRVDVKQILNKAAELQQVTKTQLGGGLVMFFPPEHRAPWNCVDPGNMQYNHSGDVWFELQQFLLYGEKKQVFLSSSSRYEAALILKNSSGMHIQSLVVGIILNLIQQAMQERKWIRKSGPGWVPLVLNLKVLLDWSGNVTQKGDLRPSTNQASPANVRKPVMQSNVESLFDKDVILSKLRGLLPQILEEGTGYNLSSLCKDFEHATGMPLDDQKLGYANLQELMKELTDVAYLEPTNSGLWLLYPVKHNENVMGLHSNMADKENNEKALRQIQVVRELKIWLSHYTSTFKDGYDISKVQADFLQASGKDLNREGLDFNKLQCIINQFRDVIHIARSPGGSWLAYPASHGVGIGIKSAKSAVISIS